MYLKSFEICIYFQGNLVKHLKQSFLIYHCIKLEIHFTHWYVYFIVFFAYVWIELIHYCPSFMSILWLPKKVQILGLCVPLYIFLLEYYLIKHILEWSSFSLVLHFSLMCACPEIFKGYM